VTSLLPFRWHVVELLALVAALVAHRCGVKSSRERRLALVALSSLAVVVGWPIGDLAASVSISVATGQRLVIMLLVAPLLLMSLPTSLLARVTRPVPVDAAMLVVAHPGAAIALVTLFGTATLSAQAVDWGATSALGRDVVLVVVLAAGVILWIPALAAMPGTRHLSPMARAGYVFASSLVVTSFSFVWIFARHPLYADLRHQYALMHMTPLFDQQLAGFVAKFGAYVPMWVVSFTIFSRAEELGVPIEETPLHWADVERAMLRVDRQRARAARRRRPERDDFG
jgi:cytochrome c oxidase assembly factor CtaG